MDALPTVRFWGVLCCAGAYLLRAVVDSSLYGAELPSGRGSILGIRSARSIECVSEVLVGLLRSC